MSLFKKVRNVFRYFAVTLVRHHRTSFDNDVSILRETVKNMLEKTGLIFETIGWEIQPNGINSMHIHALCMIDINKKIYYAELHKLSAEFDIKCDIKEIDETDVARWQFYCKKDKHRDLAYDYAESTGSEYNKINIFKKYYDKKNYCPTQKEYEEYDEYLEEFDLKDIDIKKI